MCRSLLRPAVALLILFLLPNLAANADELSDSPALWPVSFTESYFLHAKDSEQLRLEPENFIARRFHLRLRSSKGFSASIVRALDGTILWSERKVRETEALIPWGRGEFGHLTLTNLQSTSTEIVVEIAIDPNEADRRVYSFFVNRFLEIYDRGEDKRAEALLTQALAEDPQDSTAVFLLAKLWKSQGLTQSPMQVRSDEDERLAWKRVSESQQVALLTASVDSLLARNEPMRALHALEDKNRFETKVGIRRWNLLRGRVELHQGKSFSAVEAFYEALDAAPNVKDRFEVYPLLIEANIALGNTEQATAIVSRAEAEALDDAMLERAKSWRASIVDRP